MIGTMEQPLQNSDMIVPTIICASTILIMGILWLCTVIRTKVSE